MNNKLIDLVMDKFYRKFDVNMSIDDAEALLDNIGVTAFQMGCNDVQINAMKCEAVGYMDQYKSVMEMDLDEVKRISVEVLTSVEPCSNLLGLLDDGYTLHDAEQLQTALNIIIEASKPTPDRVQIHDWFSGLAH